ncbi:MAG TPA: sigma-70 family RNA polymerase sigma factor [Bacteroidales bacterium]|nr:sigma-70 family RNA polymerase sigma factor [Bacteroidales bacterium]
MDIRKLTDQELVERFVKGDDASMEILIRRHKSKVFTYLMMSVRNRDVANDLFQDTFMKVIQSLRSGRYKDEGRFLPWVMRIAHNLTIDYFRKERNLNTRSNDDNEVDLFNSHKFSDANIEDRLVDEQICTDIRSVLELLPEDQKQVVLMRHYGGMSFKEIADHTNVSINTALGRMRYALINMRKLIEENQITLTR